MAVFNNDAPHFRKHVGLYKDKRCVVVLQLPEDPSSVHVIDTDSLPDRFHQDLMDIVEMPESQNSQWLGDVLCRRMLNDGSNALKTFYANQYIQVVSVNDVVMTPRPNQHVPLRMILEAMGIQQPVEELPGEYADILQQEQQKLNEDLVVAKHNQHAENLAGDSNEQKRQIAMNLIAEAQLLESEAARKRKQAQQYDPSTAEKASLAPTELKTNQDHNPEVSGQSEVNAESDVLARHGISEQGPFVDPETGKEYSRASTLKSILTRRENQKS